MSAGTQPNFSELCRANPGQAFTRSLIAKPGFEGDSVLERLENRVTEYARSNKIICQRQADGNLALTATGAEWSEKIVWDVMLLELELRKGTPDSDSEPAFAQGPKDPHVSGGGASAALVCA